MHLSGSSKPPFLLCQPCAACSPARPSRWRACTRARRCLTTSARGPGSWPRSPSSPQREAGRRQRGRQRRADLRPVPRHPLPPRPLAVARPEAAVRGAVLPPGLRQHRDGEDQRGRRPTARAPDRRSTCADFDYGHNKAPSQGARVGLRRAFASTTRSTTRPTRTRSSSSWARATSARSARTSATACRRAAWRSTPSAAGAEEFPRFTEFWLEKPAADATSLDDLRAARLARALTGAYRFVVTPGAGHRGRRAVAPVPAQGRRRRWASRRSPACSSRARTSRSRATSAPRCTTPTA